MTKAYFCVKPTSGNEPDKFELLSSKIHLCIVKCAPIRCGNRRNFLYFKLKLYFNINKVNFILLLNKLKGGSTGAIAKCSIEFEIRHVVIFSIKVE